MSQSHSEGPLFEDEKISNWAFLRALLDDIFVQVNPLKYEMFVMLIIPGYLSYQCLQKYVQWVFDTSVAIVSGVYIIDEAISASFGLNLNNCLVLDVGHSFTKISCVFENDVDRSVYRFIPLASCEVDKALTELLKKDELFAPNTPCMELSKKLKDHGVCAAHFSQNSDVPFHESVSIEDKKYSVGVARFDCVEVLFEPSSFGLHNILSLPEAILKIVEIVQFDKRSSLLNNIVVTGLGSRIEHFRDRLKKEIDSHLASSEFSADNQIKSCRLAEIPIYMTELKNEIHFASWIGAAITSKIVFNDLKYFIKRADFLQKGVSIINFL